MFKVNIRSIFFSFKVLITHLIFLTLYFSICLSGSLNDVRVSKSRLSSIASQLPSKGVPDGTEVQTTSEHELSSSHKKGIVSNKYEIVETEMNATSEGKQEFVVNIPGLVIPEVENSEVIVEKKMKQTAEANQVIFKPCLLDVLLMKLVH
jgi:hypothetical protein